MVKKRKTRKSSSKSTSKEGFDRNKVIVIGVIVVLLLGVLGLFFYGGDGAVTGQATKATNSKEKVYIETADEDYDNGICSSGNEIKECTASNDERESKGSLSYTSSGIYFFQFDTGSKFLCVEKSTGNLI